MRSKQVLNCVRKQQARRMRDCERPRERVTMRESIKQKQYTAGVSYAYLEMKREMNSGTWPAPAVLV